LAASWLCRPIVTFGPKTGEAPNAPEGIRGVTSKNSDSTSQSSNSVWNVVTEHLSKAKRAGKPKLTATMKRRALKRKKADDGSQPSPASGS
jgi:hypothetical protein